MIEEKELNELCTKLFGKVIKKTPEEYKKDYSQRNSEEILEVLKSKFWKEAGTK